MYWYLQTIMRLVKLQNYSFTSQKCFRSCICTCVSVKSSSTIVAITFIKTKFQSPQYSTKTLPVQLIRYTNIMLAVYTLDKLHNNNLLNTWHPRLMYLDWWLNTQPFIYYRSVNLLYTKQIPKLVKLPHL